MWLILIFFLDGQQQCSYVCGRGAGKIQTVEQAFDLEPDICWSPPITVSMHMCWFPAASSHSKLLIIYILICGHDELSWCQWELVWKSYLDQPEQIILNYTSSSNYLEFKCFKHSLNIHLSDVDELSNIMRGCALTSILAWQWCGQLVKAHPWMQNCDCTRITNFFWACCFRSGLSFDGDAISRLNGMEPSLLLQ